MKGVVFTEFLEMVEKQYGYEMVDKIIPENKLSSGGAYTSVGTYDHGEIILLLSSLSDYTKEGVPSLLKAFGYYFFEGVKINYPQFLNGVNNAFAFLESIETYIHVEVRKLYPDAELPTFKTRLISEDNLEMVYFSERKMSDFAEALIEKSMEHFEEKATIKKELLEKDGTVVKFIISKK